MISYSNPFYEYMRQAKYKHGILTIRSLDKKEKKRHYHQYLSYREMTRKWRKNIKHVKAFKNRFIKESFDLIDKKLECKKL